VKATVCELPDDVGQLQSAWTSLTAHVRSSGSHLVLLPEMPFHPWIAATDQVSQAGWRDSVEAHDRWMKRFEELAPATVTGSRPVVSGGRRYNEGFVWEAEAGYSASHRKHYLPDQSGFWEASWYERGGLEFLPVPAADARAGYAICSELWFTEHARAYARSGVQLLLCPRATGRGTVDKWVAGGRAAAVVSGAFCLSSNRGGNGSGMAWAGSGWVISPDGELLGLTSAEQPCLTLDIDLAVADAAKQTYPRNVQE
jgi:predicted amidohydrolase